MTTYLKRFYFDDSKLRERALVELVRAFETGRMVAFVGSMATESFGYGGWKDLVSRYVAAAVTLAEEVGRGRADATQRKAALEAVRQAEKYAGGYYLDRQVAMSVVHEALAFLDEIDPVLGPVPRLDRLEQAAAVHFGRRTPGEVASSGFPAEDWKSTIAALAEDLRIRRFATLNYDLEIEARLMVEPRELDTKEPLDQIRKLCEAKVIKQDANIEFRLSRLMLNGLSVESDVRNRKRPDRLIDFAAGSAEMDFGIMHLHGRALEPKTMVVGLRDYDQLYRKDDPAKVPFEHGQKVLFAGNPVLFVGAGMSEPELNMTLQGFVSNNPYRRFAPTFLLWSTSGFSTNPAERKHQIWVKRIDFFRRLGVLTIFDEDLRPDESIVDARLIEAGPGEESPAPERTKEYLRRWTVLDKQLNGARDKHKSIRDSKESGEPEAAVAALEREARQIDLDLLSRTVTLVGRAMEVRGRALQAWSGRWRHLSSRFDRADTGEGGGVIALWGTKTPLFPVKINPRLFHKCQRPDQPGCETSADYHHRVVVAPAGSGKGGVAWAIAAADDLPEKFNAPPHRRLIINAGFALDTDFLLLAVSRFLLSMRGTAWKDAPKISREDQFEDPEAFEVGEPALIIINGLERFFTVAGAPLSAELDHLLRRVIADRNGSVRWILLGSVRVDRYFKFLCKPAVRTFEEASAAPGPQGPDSIASVYFSRVAEDLKQFAEKKKGRTDIADFGNQVVLEAHRGAGPRAISRNVVGTYVSAKVFARAGFEDPLLAMEILRAMAFIGTPVEATVLLHVPRVRRRLQREGRELDVELLLTVLDQLKDVSLVMAINHFEDYPGDGKGLWQRFGMHTAVSSELRHQFGVPISESKLSTSFNMSLYVAQPVDGFVPEAAIHEELGDLIDHLIGAYKDEPHPDEAATPGELEESEAPPEYDRCGPFATAALRAALAMVRSYYSTTSLLTMDWSHGAAREDKDGVLLEHAERLETLLRVYRKLNSARKAKKDRGSADLGPDPFYADDLVWILNELGVVYLAQGDLYGARRNLDQALQVNAAEVEFGSRSHNWRRISLNQVFLRIERGGLIDAEGLLRSIENSVNERGVNPRGLGRSRFDHIRQRFGEKAPESRTCFDSDIMHEEVLVVALVLGHRAICHHLRGNLLTAEPLYKEAIAVLRRLGENRAYAFFQRHYAQLYGLIEPSEASEVALRLAIAAAESVRQTDMAYHARINEADSFLWQKSTDVATRRKALRHLAGAAAYGAVMDLHRIRVEAGIHLARLKLDSGDHESALDHAADAMALATRYGMTLRKIGLRILIGHILVRRGDQVAGLALIDRAVEAADRFGYQRAVEWAQRIRLEEGL